MTDETGPRELTMTEQLVHSTVRIETDTGTGSGFFFKLAALEDGRHIPSILTNKHVIKGSTSGRFILSCSDSDGNPELKTHFPVEYSGFQENWIDHPDPNVDLCALPIYPVIEAARGLGKSILFRMLDESLIPTEEELSALSHMEDVTMIGYPNGLWDKTHNLPLFRRGVTATHPKIPLNGKREFLIDLACFPGSSGSPVLLFNQGSYSLGTSLMMGTRVKLLGVLYAGPQHTVDGSISVVTVPNINVPIARSSIPSNLGYVMQASVIKPLSDVMKTLVDSNVIE